jgi:hypothetical protein
MDTALDLETMIVLSRHAALKVRGEQEILVLPERAMHLRGSSAEILRLCEGPRTGHEVLAMMRSRYPDDPQINGQVADFLAEMLTRGALEMNSPASSSHQTSVKNKGAPR